MLTPTATPVPERHVRAQRPPRACAGPGLGGRSDVSLLGRALGGADASAGLPGVDDYESDSTGGRRPDAGRCTADLGHCVGRQKAAAATLAVATTLGGVAYYPDGTLASTRRACSTAFTSNTATIGAVPSALLRALTTADEGYVNHERFTRNHPFIQSSRVG